MQKVNNSILYFYQFILFLNTILGPQAHLFQSVHEQTYVAYVIAYAMQIGPYYKNVADSKTVINGLLFTVLLLKIIIVWE